MPPLLAGLLGFEQEDPGPLSGAAGESSQRRGVGGGGEGSGADDLPSLWASEDLCPLR